MPTLLIIDMQEDFLRHPELTLRRGPLVRAITELVEAFRARSQAVVWIKQEFEADLSDAYLEMKRRNIAVVLKGSPGAELLPELGVRSDEQVVVKKRYSAFFGTDLEAQLGGDAPLVVAGVNTHACVRMTVIDAYQRDLSVIVARDGVASNDPEHGRMTERYLDGKMAHVWSNPRILAALDSERW